MVSPGIPFSDPSSMSGVRVVGFMEEVMKVEASSFRMETGGVAYAP